MEDPITQTSATKDDFGQEILPAQRSEFRMVTVLLSNTSPMVRKDMHCFNCGRIVAQYYSDVRVIIIGEMREVKRPVDVMCSRCKILYRIA
jgi:hypothetical protein